MTKEFTIAQQKIGVHLTAFTLTQAALNGTLAANGVLTSAANALGSLNQGDPIVLKGCVNQQNNGTWEVGSNPTAGQITLVVPGTQKNSGGTWTGGTVADTTAETITSTTFLLTGPLQATQQTVSFTMLPGQMYPICADQLLATTTTAAGVLAFY